MIYLGFLDFFTASNDLRVLPGTHENYLRVNVMIFSVLSRAFVTSTSLTAHRFDWAISVSPKNSGSIPCRGSTDLCAYKKPPVAWVSPVTAVPKPLLTNRPISPDTALQPPPEIPRRATSPLRLAGREVRAGNNMNQESCVPSPPHGSSSVPAPWPEGTDKQRWPLCGPRGQTCSWWRIARCPAALHPNRLPSYFPRFAPAAGPLHLPHGRC